MFEKIRKLGRDVRNAILGGVRAASTKAYQVATSTGAKVAGAVTAINLFLRGKASAQSTSLTEANDAIVAAADRVEDLAQTVATNTSSNAITIATAALVLMVILTILGFVWSFMRGRSVRC